MTIARKEIVDPTSELVYHCVNRCVRRAFLCGRDDRTGQDFEHRKAWVRDRLDLLIEAFGIDLLAYAVMSNHLHLVLHTRPSEGARWDAKEVARRWLKVYPKRLDNGSLPKRPTPEQIEAITDDPDRVGVLRARLCDLSWFMKALSEHIARRANREDECTGRFWEGRFKCQRLLDDAAVLAAMAYVDLNPIRAGAAKSLSDPQVTSAHDRVEARKGKQRAAGMRDRVRARGGRSGRKAGRKVGVEQLMTSRERSSYAKAVAQSHDADWLAPIGCSGSPIGGFSEDSYLELLDWTGRQLRSGHRGAIPEALAPILTELSINTERWLDAVVQFDGWFARMAGKVGGMLREAARLGCRWLRGVGPSRKLFSSSQPAASPTA